MNNPLPLTRLGSIKPFLLRHVSAQLLKNSSGFDPKSSPARGKLLNYGKRTSCDPSFVSPKQVFVDVHTCILEDASFDGYHSLITAYKSGAPLD